MKPVEHSDDPVWASVHNLRLHFSWVFRFLITYLAFPISLSCTFLLCLSVSCSASHALDGTERAEVILINPAFSTGCITVYTLLMLLTHKHALKWISLWFKSNLFFLFLLFVCFFTLTLVNTTVIINYNVSAAGQLQLNTQHASCAESWRKNYPTIALLLMLQHAVHTGGSQDGEHDTRKASICWHCSI